MKRRHHQGYNARLDESIGGRHRGHHEQSLAARRHEHEAMERHYGHHPYAREEEMSERDHKHYRHHMRAAHHEHMARHHRKHSRKRK